MKFYSNLRISDRIRSKIPVPSDISVQIGTDRYLTGTISDINVYRFLQVWYGTAGTDRYGTIFITMITVTRT